MRCLPVIESMIITRIIIILMIMLSAITHASIIIISALINIMLITKIS